MAAKAETIKDEAAAATALELKLKSIVAASKVENESKPIILLRLLLGSLPEDKTEMVSKRSIELISLSEAAGMSAAELNRFMQFYPNFVVSTKSASKHTGPPKFTFDWEFKSVEDVAEFIKSSLPRRVNSPVRPQKSRYRGLR